MKPRSIVFLNRFYWPDHAATAQILTDLAEHLAADEWDVSVIAAGTPYSGGGSDASLSRREVHNGVTIRRTPAVRHDRSGTAGNLREYASYTAGALRILAGMKKTSIVVSLSDPPLLAAAVRPLARLKRSRFVHWVQDIHPDVAAQVGALPQAGAIRNVLQMLARGAHHSADVTVTIGPVMGAFLERNGVPHDRLHVIPNWVDTDAVRPLPPGENTLARELGVSNRFVVLYSGNAARSHPLDAVLGAMKTMRDRDNVVFVFIGGGPGHAEMRNAATEADLENCRFLPSLPRARIAESHSMAGACIVTESEDVAGLLFPSKSIGILASARPLLFIGSKHSEVAGLVERFQCGRVIAPGDANALVQEIEHLRTDAAYRTSLGERGRRAAVEHFDVRACCAAWERVLTSLL